MKWKLTEASWLRTVSLWAWQEIIGGCLIGAMVIMTLVAWCLMHWSIFVGCGTVTTILAMWHWKVISKGCADWFAPILLLAIGSLAIGAGNGIGTHKAEEWSKLVTYDFSPKKEKKESDEKKEKEEKQKEAKPGSKEYFDGQFAKIREEMNGIRSEVKGVRSEVDGMKKHLKIDFKSEEEPLNFPDITVNPKPKKNDPDPPIEEDGGLRLFKIAPDGLPQLPNEEPLPAKRKQPEAKEPGKFQRPDTKSPGKAPKIPSITKIAKIVESECSFGKKHPIAQFCEGEDGRRRFKDEVHDRCKDENGKFCVCLRWVYEDETP